MGSLGTSSSWGREAKGEERRWWWRGWGSSWYEAGKERGRPGGREMARWGGRRPGGKGWNRGSPRERPKFLKAASRDREFIVDLRRSFPVVPPESVHSINTINIWFTVRTGHSGITNLSDQEQIGKGFLV